MKSKEFRRELIEYGLKEGDRLFPKKFDRGDDGVILKIINDDIRTYVVLLDDYKEELYFSYEELKMNYWIDEE